MYNSALASSSAKESGYTWNAEFISLGQKNWVGTKIGMSEANVRNRVQSLIGGAPFDCELFAIWHTNQPRAVETQLHHNFKAQRIRHSEWFRFSHDDFRACLKLMSHLPKLSYSSAPKTMRVNKQKSIRSQTGSVRLVKGKRAWVWYFIYRVAGTSTSTRLVTKDAKFCSKVAVRKLCAEQISELLKQ